MEAVSTFHHHVAACPCGHHEHIGLQWLGPEGEKVIDVNCPQCSEVEWRESVMLAFEPLARVQQMAVGVGHHVKHNGVVLQIVGLDEVTKLDGRYHTDVIRLKLAATV
jgi:hypothetical protein